LDHYATCAAVAQIQVVWCTAQGEPPAWLTSHADQRVTVEAHAANSLNERFHVLQEPATYGILSVDDDVLRPCLALDAGFFKWTANPERMVGFDARGYNIRKESTTTTSSTSAKKMWAYSYRTPTKRANKYSMTLTRFSFQHVDYLKSYMQQMPVVIRDKVAKNLNCEDIAFSLWVSACTNGKAPLLADFWAMQTLHHLPSPGAISGGKGHKRKRDDCVEEFAVILNLKERLQISELNHRQYRRRAFEAGAKGSPFSATIAGVAESKPARQVKLEETVAHWKENETERQKDMHALKSALAKFARQRRVNK
jgi:glucuronyl/N-acetylglucosaminyl transferase EXT2